MICSRSETRLQKIIKRYSKISLTLKMAYKVKNKKGLHKCKTYTRCGCKKAKDITKRNPKCCRKVNVCKRIKRRKCTSLNCFTKKKIM